MSGQPIELFTIESEDLRVQISNLGAEIKSVVDIASGYEFMWRADRDIWARTAPILFPIVGRVAGDHIRANGQTYPLGQHGFARDMLFSCVERAGNSVSFHLSATDATLRSYPYRFLLGVTYRVFGRQLVTTLDVLNRDAAATMYYSIGGHPAFALPVADLSKFCLRFEQSEDLERRLLQSGLRSGDVENLGRGAARLPLSSALFDRDAVIFTDLQSRAVELVCADDPDYRVHMDFPDFPYLGVWTKPGCHEFVCIEPWLGLADPVGFDGDIAAKEGIVALPPGELHSKVFTLALWRPSGAVARR